MLTECLVLNSLILNNHCVTVRQQIKNREKDMLRKILLGTFLGLVALVTAAMLLQMVASETGEVVVVTTDAGGGESATTRLWVVDHDDAQWLRVGVEGAGWFGRMISNPVISMQRGEVSAEYAAVPVPAAITTVRGLMREKYGWRDWWVGMFVDQESATPVRLVAVEPAPIPHGERRF